MLDSHQKPHLFRAMETNQCILFVGAGFSRGATNQLGKPMPSGEELAQALWEWIAYKEPYDHTPLHVVFQAALTSGKTLSDLRRLLEQHLLASAIAPWYGVVPRVFWYRIYGTNVDDVIEQACGGPSTSSCMDRYPATLVDSLSRHSSMREEQIHKMTGGVILCAIMSSTLPCLWEARSMSLSSGKQLKLAGAGAQTPRNVRGLTWSLARFRRPKRLSWSRSTSRMSLRAQKSSLGG